MRGTFEEPPTGLIPWFSKTEGNTYATIAASPFPLQGKPTQAQDVAVNRKFASTADIFPGRFICQEGMKQQEIIIRKKVYTGS